MTLYMNENFGNIELHVHLDGSYRLSTILALATERNMRLPFDNVEALTEYFVIKEPTTLRGFLSKFSEFLNCVAGYKPAIYRTSYEFIEDCAASEVCYVEARFCPNFLCGDTLTNEDVLQTVLEAFRDANKAFGVESRVILAGIREFHQWSDEILALALKYRDQGVVGIDIAGGPTTAGDEQLSIENGGTHDHLRNIFQEAERCGLHRTVHAGENGPAESVREALEDMHAERIGHGYRVLEDPAIYQMVKERDIHLEICPTSSRLTSAVPYDWKAHPLHTFLRDQVNLSVSTDDPLLIGHTMRGELQVVQREFGLDTLALQRMMRNAARSCFLPEAEKQQLLQHLDKLHHKS